MKRNAAGLAALAIAALVGCAHMEPPSGGPVDTIPPSVVAVYPAPGARNVPLKSPVVIQFSEWVDRSAVRTQAFVSPPTRGRLRVTVEGDKLQVLPSEAADGWRPNTAYQVLVLPTLQDLHGVRAGKSFSLRFSTGASIDSASLAGSARSATPKGTMMAALYRTGDRSSVEPLSARETAFKPGVLPEPWRELPAYLALADSTGSFKFDSVAQGNYALLAFEDANGNFAFDLGFESAATGSLSLGLRPGSGQGPGQSLRTVPLDTIPLRILEPAFVIDSVIDSGADTTLRAGSWVTGKIKVSFSHPPHPVRAAEASRYRVVSDSGESLPVLSAAWSPFDDSWILTPPPLRAGRDYRVETRSRPDFPGRGAEGMDTSVSFTPGPARDTTEWRLGFVQVSANTGLPRALAAAVPGRDLTVASNRPLTPARWKTLNERLTVRIDTVPAPRSLTFVNNFTFVLQLPTQLQGTPPLGARLDLALKPVPSDTVRRSLAFLQVLDSSGVGGLRFTVPAQWAGWTFRLEAADNTAYRVPAEVLPAGRYRLFAFRDLDGDSIWNPGSLKPWIPQEPYAQALDSVAVVPGAATDISEALKRANP